MRPKPIVTMLDHSSRNEENVATAGRACYSKRVPADIYGGFILDESATTKQIRKLVDAGHYSTMEHTFFMFSVEGISRAATHQLVRHRHLSYEQQSQRYSTVSTGSNDWYVTPDIEGEALEEFHRAMAQVAASYEHILKLGVKPEDARAVLPNATKTSIIVSGNARAFYEMLTLRTCNNAQAEIREMGFEMLRQLKFVAPALFQNAGATCVRNYCLEPNGPQCPRYIIIRNKETKNAVKGPGETIHLEDFRE